MILLPLGFGRKLPTFPWATLALTLSILFVSIPYFKNLKRIEASHHDAMKASGYSELLKKFAVADCPGSGLEIEECSTLSGLIDLRFDLKKVKGKKASATVAAVDDEKKRNAKILKAEGFSKGLAQIAKSKERTLEYAKILLGETSGYSQRMASTEGYDGLVEAEKSIQQAMAAEYKADYALSRSNQGILQLVLAQWTHMGWMHLIGNLFVFLALAPVLEARMGRIAFLGLYVLGGTIGLLVQLYLLKSTSGILLGASANISAVIGGFFVFYFRRPMKVLASFVFYNRLLDCPTWLMIPVLFLLGDLAGALDHSSGTAHVAHLVGFAVGAAMAFFMKQNDGLHEAYIYPVEYDWHLELRAATSVAEKIRLADTVLKYNPENYLVEKEVLDVCVQFTVENPSRVDEQIRGFLNRQFAHALTSTIRRGKFDEAKALVEQVPLQNSLIEILAGMSQPNLIRLGEAALKKGDWLSAFRIYDSFRRYYPKASGSKTMEETMDKVLNHLHDTGVDLSVLASYPDYEPETTFISTINKFTLPTSGDAYEFAS